MISSRMGAYFDPLHDQPRDTNNNPPAASKRVDQKLENGDDVGIWHEAFLARAHKYEAVSNSITRMVRGQFSNRCPLRVSWIHQPVDRVEPVGTILP